MAEAASSQNPVFAKMTVAAHPAGRGVRMAPSLVPRNPESALPAPAFSKSDRVSIGWMAGMQSQGGAGRTEKPAARKRGLC